MISKNGKRSSENHYAIRIAVIILGVDVYIDEWRCYEEFHQKLTEETFTLMNGSLCSVSSESVNIIIRMPKV
ncbi:hypothetical protein T4C_1968 [Trichinella pseudospiralis]|uniref:Uncharacterized protein n=1 Tax=Trichinella pseudospiralis TaxID=6337 RepID=A0A0V1IDI4_TRIPS|nr:hypothetical protein T4C_1968 [Trichinella pseudospiralis]